MHVFHFTRSQISVTLRFQLSAVGSGAKELIVTVCEILNDDECAQIGCKVESYFVYTMFNFITQGTGAQPDLYRALIE